MVTTMGWLYLAAGTVLFFFWAYGLVSFVRDLKNVYVPASRELLTTRRERLAEARQEDEREERRRQLY